MIYLLDTNAISDLIVDNANVVNRVDQRLANGDKIGICRPVFYELARGLLWRKATKKFLVLQKKIIPKLDWIPLADGDWLQAAQFWAGAVRAGRQLSDMDFLLAALAYRLNAVIVSSDGDFDALPVKREDWRLPLP